MMKAVIFDLDGVLVSTDELHFNAWKKLAEEIGVDGFSREDNLRQRGVSRMDSLEIVLEKSDKTYTSSEKEQLADTKNRYYVAMLQSLDHSATLPGAVETLKQLRDRGIRIACGSASKNAPLILEKVGLLEMMDEIACGHDTTKSKPDPEVFLVAAKKLGVAPDECIVVEDADAGIKAAVAGGMKALGVGPAANNPEATWSAASLADASLDWNTLLS